MFGSPRVLAVDDNKTHLGGLVNGLQRNGVACLPIHFPDGLSALVDTCPDVRIIFADLHLVGQASDYTRQFTALGGLIEATIVPRGPYFILLWTRYPEQATALATFLDQNLQSVTKPFAVIAIDKSVHLDGRGNVKDEEELMAEIVALTSKLPEVGALFDWERNVLHAAGDTVSSVLSLASTRASADRAAEAGRILTWLGIEAVGREHVENDRFRAVNEALLPILADRIANLRSNEDVWKNALAMSAVQQLSPEQAGSLNRMVHLDMDARASSRGAVIPLPPTLQKKFQASFSLDEKTAADKQFHCTDFVSGDDRYRWVLVHAQAACDYAQSSPGPVPCYLGLEMPYPARRRGSLPSALWTSPALELRGKVRQLRVSAAFPVSMEPAKFNRGKPVYRLREQILNDLIYHVHSHGARPGLLSFRDR